MFKLCKMTVVAVLVVFTTLAMIFTGSSSYAPGQVLALGTAPTLGVAQSFGVLGASAVTNTGPSVIQGDLGISPGNASSVTGFSPGHGQYTGTLHAADAVAIQAQSDVTIAYDALAAQPYDTDLTGQDLGERTLTPGVYNFDSSAGLTGQLTLDANSDPDPVFIFQIGSTLTTASGSSVVANFCSNNIYWQVGSSATLGTTTTFLGNILALASITLKTGATLEGRALARNGAVTMDDNDITVPVCSITPLPGTLEIFKFNDLNGNGVYNPPTETPLAGWAFTVAGGPTATPGPYSTDVNGLITLTGLQPGNYTVTETLPLPPGWTSTTLNPQTGLVPTAGVMRLNFGNRQPVPPPPGLGNLEIFKFDDLNGNGVYEPALGETPLANWAFTVVGAIAPGPYFTDPFGLITLIGLAVGNYTVTETLPLPPPVWTATTLNPQVGVVIANVITRLNFGNQQPVPLGTLEIFKFNDLNGNGVYEPLAPDLETPIQGWAFTVSGGPTLTPGPYSTDINGLISIPGLAVGNYTVTETAQLGWTATTLNPQIGTMSVNAGMRLNFGNQQPAVLQIFKFNDLNGNGVYNPPIETPLANWQYEITGPGGYDQTRLTDGTGLITLTSLVGLVPGVYTVTETVQPGWIVTTNNGNNTQTVTVLAGSENRLNFGNKPPKADLRITKTGSPDVVAPGDNITYTITVTNGGPYSATGVVVTDILPSGVTFTSATPSQGNVTESGGTVTWDVGTLIKGSSATLKIVVTVNPPSANGLMLSNKVNTECAQCNVPIIVPICAQCKDGAVLTNKASVKANETDSNPWNNVAYASTTVKREADLLITKTASPDPVLMGSNLTYTLTVTNRGPLDATGVVAKDILPSGVTFVSATPSKNVSYNAGVVTWNVGNLNSGVSASLTIVVKVSSSLKDNTVLTNYADVNGNETDSNILNNRVWESTTATTLNLKFTKTDSLWRDTNCDQLPGPGDTMLYTVVITNASKSAVSGVIFSDTPDANTTLVVGSVTTTSGSVGTGNKNGDKSVSVNMGTITAGGKVTITFKVTINKNLTAQVTQISNQGTLSSTNFVTRLSDDPDTYKADDPTVTHVTNTYCTTCYCK